MQQPDLARRGLLRGLALLPVAGAASLAASADACPVATAIDAYRAAETAHAEAEADLVAAQLRLDAMPYPDIPAALLIQPGDDALGFRGKAEVGRPGYLEQIRAYRLPRTRLVTLPYPADGPGGTLTRREPWPEAQARADELVAAHDAYEAALEAREQASGLPAAHAAEEAACRQVQACGAAIAAASATTAAGVLRKAAMVMSLFVDREDLDEEIRGCSTDRAVGLSIVRDLIDIEERAS